MPVKKLPLQKIVSGGQTGVDRAALDFGLAFNIPIGGWCPKGRQAEDGSIPSHYPLQDTPSTKLSQRTKWNVRDSDGTLVLTCGNPAGGTALTIHLAKQYRKPYLVIDLNKPSDPSEVSSWLIEHNIHIVNIAGPRQSTDPAIYQLAYTYMGTVLNSDEGDRADRMGSEKWNDYPRGRR